MSSTPAQPLRIDVVSDVVCPWCFIGKRQLERAVETWIESHPGDAPPQVYWHPFQLNPDLPAEGVARDEYLRAKFGSDDTSRLYANVRRAAADVELDLKLETIARQPNTMRAHALIALALEAGLQQQMAEALFDAYFIEGRDLTDLGTLSEIASGVGLDPDLIAEAIGNPDLHRAIGEADARAREMGIRGVPFFIVGGKYALSGAQGAEALVQAFERASTDEPTPAEAAAGGA